ncbi:hypothetical protein CMI47_19145 [Candidatus Pacearchaeota archaeon]|nr:hypothetical protein [Candidatus Pacearchaeota archaeon]|tara:strand:- start:165 stop:383 length:219 start_codon:yes stop_codon:yes gene_type:complete
MTKNEICEYFPEQDEIDSTVSFMLNCSNNDLEIAWTKVACEWNVSSVVSVHRELCKSGRINLLISIIEDKHE